MGYQTYFSGEISIEPALNAAEIAYLNAFNATRHVDRPEGRWFVGNSDIGAETHPQGYGGWPGYYCQWVPTEDGAELVWDEMEKFYDAAEWMEDLITNFLMPGAAASKSGDSQFAGFTFDHVCNGTIHADGEESDDQWLLVVTDNEVEVRDAVVLYPDRGSLVELEAMADEEDGREWPADVANERCRKYAQLIRGQITDR